MKLLRFIIQLILTVMSCLFAIGGCGGDDPVKPVVKDPVDYIVYARDSGKDSVVYRFHVLTHAVDSIHLPVVGQELVYPSADGKRLYITKGTHALVCDAQSLELLGEVPYPTGGFVASRDNKLIALSGSNRITVFRSVDYTAVFTDTGITSIVAFSPANDTIYGWRLEPGGLSTIYRANIKDSTVFRDTVPSFVHRMVPAADGSRWFLFRQSNLCMEWFVAYDPAGDTAVFTAQHTTFSRMLLSADGRYLYYAYPQSPTCDGSQPLLRVFNVRENRIVNDIHARCVNDSLPDCGDDQKFLFRNFVVTPDDRWIIGTNGWQYLSVIDVQTMDVAWNFAVPGAIDVNGLTVQSGE